jgi:hypothetical protein
MWLLSDEEARSYGIAFNSGFGECGDFHMCAFFECVSTVGLVC